MVDAPQDGESVSEYSSTRIDMRHDNALNSADPDDISAQIDLIGVLGPMIGGKPSAAPNGGSARGYHELRTSLTA
jgi:hypothetical protein